MSAAAGGHTAVCAYLLSMGASALDKDREGHTVIHFAAYAIFMALESAPCLLLGFLFRTCLRSHLCRTNASVPLLSMLVSAGASATDVDKKGESALHVVCKAKRECLAAAQYLCEETKCDVDAINTGGWSSAFFAVALGHTALLEYLLTRGASLHQRTTVAGWTLLHAASANNQVAMLDLLVRKGLSLHTRATNGNLAIGVAPERSQCEKRLFELGAEEAALTNHLELFAYCVASGVDLETRGAYGRTLLESAVVGAHPDILGFLAHRRLASRPDALRAATIALVVLVYLLRG
jgi:ankyrin repeat protein